MDTFIRNKEDIYREYQLKDDGVILDASVFTEIVISYEDSILDKLAEYKLSLSEVTVVNADLGTISCIIPKATTDDKKLGQYKVQIVTTEADVNFPSNIRTRAGKEVDFELISEIE